MKTDLLIIGSGPGGYETAAYAAKHGLQVVIAEESHVGGTCLNSGCIPTKSLVHDAEKVTDPTIGAALYQEAIARKDDVVARLRQGVEAVLSQPGITLMAGHAAFRDEHTVCVGDEEIVATHIIIATGSTAKLPPVPGLGVDDTLRSPYVLTSEQLLQQSQRPDRLCIVGAGVIGMEMASVFAAFGSQVTVVEYLKECLPTLDSEIAKRLRKMMEKQGVKFYLNTALQRVDDKQVTICDNKKGNTQNIEADAILIATGRKPRTDHVALENTTIEVGRSGIVVNDQMQTSVPHIYAIGDVNGRQMLAHAATFQGYRAVNHILGRTDHIRLDIMPAAVFTHPEAASVGPTEDDCKQRGVTYTVGKAIYRANGRAQAIEQTDGLVKLLFDEHDAVIACHTFGADSSAIVQEVAALMNMDITRSRLADIVHVHPTLSEILLAAVRE